MGLGVPVSAPSQGPDMFYAEALPGGNEKQEPSQNPADAEVCCDCPEGPGSWKEILFSVVGRAASLFLFGTALVWGMCWLLEDGAASALARGI